MAVVSFCSTIKGGLPVEVTGTIHGPDREVGIFHSYCDEVEIYWPGGKTLLSDKALEGVSEQDIERLKTEAEEANTWGPDI